MSMSQEVWLHNFWHRVEKSDTCWLWVGATNTYGYGIVSRDGRRWMAHRVAYEQMVGPIPGDLVLDHLCRVRNCVNPQHLEPVTIQENLLRGDCPGRRTHCPRGHLYDEGNTYLSPSGDRNCIKCHRSRQAEAGRRRATCPECGQERQERRLSAHILRMHREARP